MLRSSFVVARPMRCCNQGAGRTVAESQDGSVRFRGASCCAGFGSQAQTHALLRQLLLLLRLGSKREAVRGPLLDALLSYLQACRGPRIAHASADLFQAAIAGSLSAWLR